MNSSLQELDAPTGALRAEDATANQFLTFLLGDEEYGVNILRVQEIRGWDHPTPIPNAADYIRGVINLRGEVIPIVDLRRRFNKESVPNTKTTVVIVVKVQAANAERTIGLMVDAVSEVRNVGKSDLRPVPDLGAGQSAFVKGLATVGKDMIILLDIDCLVDLSSTEI